MKRIFAVIILIMLSVSLLSCNSGGFLTEVTDIRLYDGDIKAAEKEISAFIKEFEQKVSVNIKDSDVSKLNSAKAGIEIEVSPYIIDMINISKAVYDETGGAFNPCIYPVLSLYDFKKGTVPSDEEIDALLPYIDIDDLTVKGNYIIKKYNQMQIDFGGIAKGYATDKCVEIAKRHGITSGIIDIGRNIYLIGGKITNGTRAPFVVGITNPRDGYLFGKINLSDMSAVTSGDYERYFIKDGVRYCHIVDGQTGKRPDSDLISVTVFGENSTLCDAYSTALFVMGMEKAVEFANANGLKVLLINENKKYCKSKGLNIYDIDGAYVNL